MSDDDLQPFRLPASGATPDAGAGPLGTGDDQHADAEGTPPEPGRPVTRGLAWAGLSAAGLAVLGGLWLPLAAAAVPGVVLLASAFGRRRWDDFRTQTIVRTAMGLVVVAFASTMGGFLYRDQRDAIRDLPMGALREGQCVIDIPTTLTSTRAHVRRCAMEHYFYVPFTMTWPEGPRPEDAELTSTVQRECVAHLAAAYPGWADDALLDHLDVRVFFPFDEAWARGMRITVCVVGRDDGTPLEGPSQDEIDDAGEHDSALPGLGR